MLTLIIGDILFAFAFGIPATYLIVGEILHQYALHHNGRLPEWLEDAPRPKEALLERSRTPEPEGDTSHD